MCAAAYEGGREAQIKKSGVKPLFFALSQLGVSKTVYQGVAAFADGDACGDGGHQDNDMLTLDHWLDIVAENHLAIGVVFRCDHVDSAVSVHGEISGACKFLGEQSTDDLGAVQTKRLQTRLLTGAF